MNDTPRTDAARMPLNSHNYKHEVVHIDTCIELERENAALREDKERLEKAFDQLVMDRDLFCYLCWLEENRDRDVDLKGADYLVMASDGTTCWGKTYREAVMVAEQYDRAAIDAARKEAKP